MSLKRYIIIAFSFVGLLSCATSKHGSSNNATINSLYATNDSLLASYYYSEGIKQSLLEQPERSADLFRKVLSIDSLHAPSYYELATLCATDNPDSALVICRRAVEIDSTNMWYRNLYGQLLLHKGEWRTALGIFDRLLTEDPHNPMYYNVVAALYNQNRQPFSAIAVLDSAEYKLGRIDEMAAFKRQLLMDVGLYDKAIEQTQSLIVDQPYKSDNFLILAELYAATNKDSLARNAYDDAFRLDSTNVTILQSAAQFYRSRRETTKYFEYEQRLFLSPDVTFEQKRDRLEQLTSNQEVYRANYFQIGSLASILAVKYADNYQALERYTDHLIRGGFVEQALDLLKENTQRPEKNISNFYAILDIEGYLQHQDSVEKYSSLALEYFPRNSNLYVRKGYTLNYLKRPQEALASFEKAYRYADSDSLRSSIRGICGDLHHQEGRVKKCYADYRSALRLNPDNAVVLNNYAYFLSEANQQLEKALEMSAKANELSKTNSTYLDTYAWILYRLGRYEQAKRSMQQALSFDTTQSDVLLLHYGDILYALGDHFMAKVYWRRALEKGYDADQIMERINKLEQK